MANQNPFSLVRRLTSTILILLLVLLVIQIAGTLWGRYMVTQELYSSAQNNVNYLRDTFEENVQQIQREMTNQLFYQDSPQLITFYTQLRMGSFSTNAHYHWELNQLKLELNVAQQMNAMIGGMDIYFPKLERALSVRQRAISLNAAAYADIQNIYAAFRETGFRFYPLLLSHRRHFCGERTYFDCAAAGRREDSGNSLLLQYFFRKERTALPLCLRYLHHKPGQRSVAAPGTSGTADQPRKDGHPATDRHRWRALSCHVRLQ